MKKVKENLKMKGKMLKTSVVVSALVASPLVVQASVSGGDICCFLYSCAVELGCSDGFCDALFTICMKIVY